MSIENEEEQTEFQSVVSPSEIEKLVVRRATTIEGFCFKQLTLF